MLHLSWIDRLFQHRQLSRVQRWGFGLLLGVGIVLLLSTQVRAAEMVTLQYRDERLMLPLTELQSFAGGDDISPDLQTFLADTAEDPEQVRQFLTTKIAPPANVNLPTEFILLQLNKILGDPLGREDLESLGMALASAYSNDQAFSVMEVLENYPKSDVRLVLNRLERVYTDVELVVTRLQPILNVAKKLLPELVCECSITTASDSIHQSLAQAYTNTRNSLKSVFAVSPLDRSSSFTPISQHSSPNDRAFGNPDIATLAQSGVLLASTNSQAVSQATSQMVSQAIGYANKQLVFNFGPLRPSISLSDLTTFAETGELSRGWRFYLNVANVNRADVRNALTKEVAINLRQLDRQLNSLLGEFLLYEVGQLIQTPSGRANIQALRSAMILSVVDDNRFSLLEILQNYPTQQIQVNGLRVARLGKNLSRFNTPTEGVVSVASDLEGWLVQVQATVAEDVCTCDPDNAVVALPAVPGILSSAVAPFLPADWQPVASHREDRGIIKVVWLQGTPYDMGYQHGQLLHDEIASIGSHVIEIAQFASKGFALGHLAANRSYPDLAEECRGLSDATQDLGITQDVCMMMAYADVFQEVLGYTLPAELFWNGCNQFVATNEATLDGRLYHGSSVDNDEKPVPYVINNPVLFVRQPNDGLPHVFVTYPGVVWPNSGMNVAGISLGLDTAHPNSPDELSLMGRSNVQIMAKILQTATSFDEARSIMETQPRVRANLIMITDGKSRQAGVFEFTGKDLGVRELQDNGVLYTTNHFVLPEMFDKQALPPDQSSISRFDRLAQLLEPDQPDSFYGSITPDVMATILRDRVNPYTKEASPLDLFDDDASPGGNGSLRQALYDPEQLRLWIAAGQPPVPENPFVCFSLGELLNFPNAAPCQSPAL